MVCHNVRVMIYPSLCFLAMNLRVVFHGINWSVLSISLMSFILWGADDLNRSLQSQHFYMERLMKRAGNYRRSEESSVISSQILRG